MSSPTTYELVRLFAIKYAELDRPAPENFVFRDVHDGPMPLDFFLWVAKSPERVFVIDTGFSEETGSGATARSSATRARAWPRSTSTRHASRT